MNPEITFIKERLEGNDEVTSNPELTNTQSLLKYASESKDIYYNY